MSWTRTTIGALGRVVTGKTPPTNNREFYDGEYPFVTPTDLDWQSYVVRGTHSSVTELARDRNRNQFIPADATMFTCIGNTIGKCGISAIDCLTNQQINSVVPNQDHDPKFIYYLLNYNRPQIRSIGIGNGAAQPIINKTVFSGVQVLVPPSRDDEQRISAILSAYDDLIENNRRRIALLEDAARQLYKEWFVRFRFPGHEHVEMIDGVPEGWAFKTIEEVCETIGGGTPSTKKPEYWDDGDVLWFTPTDVTRNSCLALLTSETKISESGLNNSSAKMIPAGAILMTSRASVGFFGINRLAASTNQGFINIVPHDSAFRMYILQNLMWRVEEIRSHAGGATYKEISKGRFRALPILVPPAALAGEYEQQASLIHAQVETLHISNQQLAKARDLLLPKLMNGTLTV